MLYKLYYNNNDIIHANIYYIQFLYYISDIYHVPGGNSHSGCGSGLGQGHT